MGLARGLVSSVQNLLGQIVTALKFTSTQASGSDGFSATTNGARWHVGAGASDYFSSDGTTIAFAGPIAVTSVEVTGTTPAVVGMYEVSGNVLAFSTNSVGRMRVDDTNGLCPVTDGAIPLGTTATRWKTLAVSTTDSSGTPGNATANTGSGQAAIAIGAATVVITNNLVATTSKVFAALQFADATATTILRVIPAAGSFTITVNANATAATKVGWFVVQ